MGYDLKVTECVLEVGDLVLVKNVGLRGKHKIADRWSQTVYKVVKHIDNSPVYVVAPQSFDGPERTLHRDLLLPCGFLSPSVPAEAEQSLQAKSKANNSRKTCVPEEEVENQFDLSSAEEIEYYYPVSTVHDTPSSTFTVVREILRENPPKNDQEQISPDNSHLNV